MSKSAKSEGRKKAADRGQLWLRLPGLVREALYETVIGSQFSGRGVPDVAVPLPGPKSGRHLSCRPNAPRSAS